MCTPRPSILLVNTLGEGKMIEIDIQAIKSISKQRRRESKLSIKQVKLALQRNSLISHKMTSLEVSPSLNENSPITNRSRSSSSNSSASSSSSSEESDNISSVSSLKAEDFEFLAHSPSLKQCLQEEAIRVSSIKVFDSNGTPLHNRRISFQGGQLSSSKKPLEANLAKQMMRNLL